MSGQTLIERLRYIRGRAVEYVEWRKAGFQMTNERDTYPDDLYSAAVRAEAMVPLLDEVLAALSHPDLPLRLEACDAAASEPELSEDDVGALAYRGNTVSYMYDRAKAYGDEIMRTWFALKAAGLHPGRTDERLSDCVKRILAASPSPAPAPHPHPRKKTHD